DDCRRGMQSSWSSQVTPWAAGGPAGLRARLLRDDVSFVVEGDVDGFSVLHRRASPDALVILLEAGDADESLRLDPALGLRLREAVRTREWRHVRRRAGGPGLVRRWWRRCRRVLRQVGIGGEILVVGVDGAAVLDVAVAVTGHRGELVLREGRRQL